MNEEMNQAADEILEISILTTLSGQVNKTAQQALILVRTMLIDEFGISIEEATFVTRTALWRRANRKEPQDTILLAC